MDKTLKQYYEFLIIKLISYDEKNIQKIFRITYNKYCQAHEDKLIMQRFRQMLFEGFKSYFTDFEIDFLTIY